MFNPQNIKNINSFIKLSRKERNNFLNFKNDPSNNNLEEHDRRFLIFQKFLKTIYLNGHIGVDNNLVHEKSYNFALSKLNKNIDTEEFTLLYFQHAKKLSKNFKEVKKIRESI